MILIVLTRFKHSQLWGKRPHYVDILSLTIFGRHWLIKDHPNEGARKPDFEDPERPGLGGKTRIAAHSKYKCSQKVLTNEG